MYDALDRLLSEDWWLSQTLKLLSKREGGSHGNMMSPTS